MNEMVQCESMICVSDFPPIQIVNASDVIKANDFTLHITTQQAHNVEMT